MAITRSGAIGRRRSGLRLGLCAVAVAAAMMVTACASGGSDVAGGATGESGKEPSTVSIAIGGANSFANLPTYIAQSQGFIDAELKPLGAKAEFVDFSDSTAALKSLLAGQTNYMAGQASTMLNAVASGQKIQALAQFFDTDIVLVVARKGVPTDVKQLADMNWGITAFGTTNEVTARTVAAQNGLDPDKIKLIAVGPPAAYEPAITSGKVDVIFAGQPGGEDLIASGEGSLILNLFDPATVRQVYGGPYASSLLMGTTAYAQQNPEVTKAVVSAHVKALQWLQQHLDDPDAIAAALPQPMRSKNIIAVLQRISAGLSQDGLVRPEALSTTIKAADSYGFFEGHPTFDLDAIVNNGDRG